MARNFFLLLLLLLLCIGAPLAASAATLSILPIAGSLSSGQSITLTVRVASPDQAVNAVSGVITIPSNVSVVSVSKGSSIVNFWTTEPSVSGKNVSFEGVILNPGYQGPGATVMTMTLKGNAPGTADVAFQSGSVLANDGNGTEVLQSMSGAKISIQEPSTPPSTPPSIPIPQAQQPIPVVSRPGTPGIPDSAFPIVSSTHPDQLGWYNKTTGMFSWEVPKGATASRILLDRKASSVPSVLYATALSGKTINSLPEGTSYLHVQFKVGGAWGGVGAFRVNIDTLPPQTFQIRFPHGSSGFDPQPIILFNTTDDQSGIEHYDVKVGDGGALRSAASAESNPYTLPPQNPGSHTVVVTAFDRAGNATVGAAGFFIEGIDPPRITNYKEEVTYGDIIKFLGTTYENSTVDIIVRQGNEIADEETAISNSSGTFGTVLVKRLAPGAYTVTARVTDARGARSAESAPITFVVKSGLMSLIASFIVNYLALALLALAAVGGLAAAGVWGWLRMRPMMLAVKKETREAESTLHKSFTLLKKDIRSHVERLNRARKNRDLTEEEVAFLSQFERDLEEAEHIIEDELKDIGKTK